MKIFSVLLWFAVLAIPAIGAAYSLGFLGAMESGPTTDGGGGLAGAAGMIGLVGLTISGIAAFLVIRLKPDNAAFTPANTVIGAMLAIAVVVLALELPNSTPNYSLTLRVYDSQKKPVQGAGFHYYLYQPRLVVGGRALRQEKTTSTDALGQVTLQLNQLTTVFGSFKKAGYRKTAISIDTSYLTKKVQHYQISWDRRDLPPGTGENALYSHFDLGEKIFLLVYLPGSNEENKMPYVLEEGDRLWPETFPPPNPNQAAIDMDRDIASLVSAATGVVRTAEWSPSVPEVTFVARHGKSAAPKLLSLLSHGPNALIDSPYIVVDQQVQLALCEIFQEPPMRGRTVYLAKAFEDENRKVRAFWVERVKKYQSDGT